MAAEEIVVTTDHTALVLDVADNGRLYQKYLGKKLRNAADYKAVPRGAEAYITHGMEDYYEPALHINHADGNHSTLLTYVGHTAENQADGSTLTTVTLTDKAYGDGVKLFYQAYPETDIIKSWSEITNGEKKPVVVDAVLKGTPGIDPERAFRAVRGSSMQTHTNFPVGVWEKYGYFPEDLQTQSVSLSLEVAYDDRCVALLAKKLGHEADYEHFMARSRNYRNLFNPESGFFQARTSSGEWLEGFDPVMHGANGGSPFTEGNAWQYFWYVPQDIPDLVALTGGKKAFEKKLDTFFTLVEEREYKNQNVSGEIGQYAHGNEPSHHVAYLYNWAGRPDKASAMTRRILTTLYDNTSGGYAGNDDCGEMSSWYVFSAPGSSPSP